MRLGFVVRISGKGDRPMLKTGFLFKAGLPGMLLIGLLASSVHLHGKEAESGAMDGQALKAANALSKAFRAAAQEVRPAVVNISSVKRVKMARGFQQPDEDSSPNDPFWQFFGQDFFGRMRPEGPSKGFEQRGQGTGFIVSADGFILTNNHVVDAADEITVKLADGRQIEKVKVVGCDPKTDLAVLKIEAPNLSHVAFGDSDTLGVGDWVLAIGNPFGLDQTVTAGIVSAKGRAHVGLAEYEDFIQTDAAINPGNSGGPLVGLDGKVVGINTAMASRSGGYMGIGFAIPVNMAQSIMDSLIKTGKVQRGRLGVMIQDLNEDLAKSFGFKKTEGVLVGDVEKGAPAEKAGMKSGDIIVGYEGKPTPHSAVLRNLVASTKPGSEVSLKFFREGQEQSISVKLGELDAGSLPASKASEPGNTQALGLAFETLSPQVAERLGLQDQTGALVTGVQPGSPAASAGLRPDDVIVSVNGEATPDAAALSGALKKHDLKAGVRMQIKSQGMSRFVFIKTGGADTR